MFRFILLFQVYLLIPNQAKAIEGFYSYETLPEQFRLAPEVYAKAEKAVYKLELGQGLIAKCSGQFISNQGHFLTALHCIDIASDVYDSLDINLRKFSDVFYLEVGKTHPENYFFRRASISKNGEDFYVGEAQAILLGKGFTRARPHYIPEQGFDLSLAARDKIVEYGEDYLIIKLPVESDCVPTGSFREGTENKLWGLGFPAQATRSNTYTDGESLYITAGLKHESMIESDEVRGFDSNILAEYNRTYITSARSMSDMDAWSEMSGSMVINANGEMVGITVGGLHHSDQYVYVGSEMVNLSYIREQAQVLLGVESANEVFDCKIK